uniref:Uncharacterized protein n=1 Tax=viral metagenome TaxID=1070528 RepID=A0A6C0BU54_9ZZZZ
MSKSENRIDYPKIFFQRRKFFKLFWNIYYLVAMETAGSLSCFGIYIIWLPWKRQVL